MKNIPRGTKVITLLNYLLKPKMGLYEPPIPQADVHCAAIITDSRLDDELSVATISFAITPLWLQFLIHDPYGLPKKTPLGTLWAGVDRNAIDVAGQTAFIKAVKQDDEDLLFAEMLAEFEDTDVNIQDNDGMTALHWACSAQRPVMVQLCLSVPDCVTGLREKLGRTAFDIAASTDHGTIPDLFYRNIMEIEAESPQSALLRLLTITSEPNKDAPTFPGIALFDPVEASNEPLVLALIDRGIDITARNANGDTALHVAAGKGNVVIGTAILNAGSDVNSRGNGGATPLHYAATTGNAEMVDAILAAGADMTIEDHDGNLAVHLAEQNNYFRIAQVLDTHRTVLVSKRATRATVAQQAEDGDKPPDIQFVGGGPAAAVDTIPNSDRVSAPEDPRAVADGRSWLRYGPENEKDRVLKELLQMAFAGGNDGTLALQSLVASVRRSRGQASWKALDVAVECGNLEMCRFLLAAGADINLPNGDGEPLLNVAVDTGEIAMVRLLLSSGVNLNGVGAGGQMALHCAARCQFSRIITGGSIDKSKTTAMKVGTQIVSILLAAGAKVNTVGERRFTALHSAAESGGLETVVLLLESGASVGAIDPNHYQPLHIASIRGNASIVSRLLLHGALIDARTRIVSNLPVSQISKWTKKVVPKRASGKKFTALHIAATCGHSEVVRILLENGAVFNSDSVFGTPRQMTAGHTDVIALLDAARRNYDEGTGSSSPARPPRAKNSYV